MSLLRTWFQYYQFSSEGRIRTKCNANLIHKIMEPDRILCFYKLTVFLHCNSLVPQSLWNKQMTKYFILKKILLWDGVSFHIRELRIDGILEWSVQHSRQGEMTVVIALWIVLKTCGYYLLGRIFVQIKCQDHPSPPFQISFSGSLFTDRQFLSLYVRPLNSKAGESIKYLQSTPHRDPQRPPLELQYIG